jgi:hypothetical protein
MNQNGSLDKKSSGTSVDQGSVQSEFTLNSSEDFAQKSRELDELRVSGLFTSK